MLSRRLLLTTSLGFTLSASVCRAKVASALPVPEIHPMTVGAEAFYPLIELRGDAAERGRTYGRAAKDAIARNIDFYATVFKKSAGISWEKAQALSQKFLPVIEKFCPDAISEMKGIALGSERRFEEILTLNCRSEVLFANAQADACSCVIIPSEAGAGGDVYMGQTWDWFASARPNSVILKIFQEDKPTILMVAEAGLIGGKGLNSEGIAICLNATSVGKGKIGVPLHLLMRNVLDSDLPTAAIKAVSAVPRAGAGTFNIATRSDFEMIVEFSPDQFDVIMSTGEPLIHTNHYLSPLIAPHDAAKNFIPSTFTRFNTMEKRLKHRNGKIGGKELFRLLSDHEHYPESICYHEDPRLKGDRYASVYAMVMNVSRGILWISRGYPCEGQISEYRL